MNKIRIMELAMNGNFHSEINSCFCKIMRNVFPDYCIAFYAGKNHIKNIRVSEMDIKMKPFLWFPMPSLRNILARDVVGCFYVLKEFFKSDKTDIFFITYALPMTHWIISVLNAFFKRKSFIMLHGQLEAYIPDTSLHGTKYYFNIERPLYRKFNNISYILLGKSILDNVKHIFSDKSKIIVLDHPYEFPENCQNNNIRHSYPLTIGQIGVGNMGKGTDILFTLADKLKDLVQKGIVKFELIGCLDSSLKVLDNGLVEYAEKPLPSDLFHEKIKGLSYSLILRNKSGGKTVASGSFLDTIKFGIPFLSLENDYVRTYASKVGLSNNICNSIDDMELLIRERVGNFDSEKYIRECNMVCELKQIFSTDEVSKRFKEQL